jgi:3',5'-nucleoside bisphosphate phosphatase
MNRYRAELHVHTVLSPCAEVEMIPPLIVQVALDKGINLIAITDHNASANVKAVQQAAKDLPITVLPGMEVQTKEEVHILTIFDTLEQLDAWQHVINQYLPEMKNDPDHFGAQFVVNDQGEFLRHENQMLLISVQLSIESIVAQVNQLGGIAIPAHVNRKSYGLLEILGFIPPELQISAVEVSRHISPTMAVKQYPQLTGYPVFQSGDVHRLDEFLGTLALNLDSPTVNELRWAFANSEGRMFSHLES